MSGGKATRGAKRARRRRMVGDARRVRERARRVALRRFGRLFHVVTDLGLLESKGSTPIGARVFLRPKGWLGDATLDGWIYDGAIESPPLDGSWRPDGVGFFAGKDHKRGELRDWLAHRGGVIRYAGPGEGGEILFDRDTLDDAENPF